MHVLDVSHKDKKLDAHSVSQHKNQDRNGMSSMEGSALYDMKDYNLGINFDCASPTQVKKRSSRRGQDRNLHLQEGRDCCLEGADVSPCRARSTPHRYTPQHHAALTMTLTTITVILTLHLVLLGDPVTAQDNQEKILLPTLDGE